MWRLLEKLWNRPVARVQRALRKLRPELGRHAPPIVRWHVLGELEGVGVIVYIACQQESDRAELERRLPTLEIRLTDVLSRDNDDTAARPRVKLIPASLEMVDREGGFWAYAHNH